jgi:hypothetical protein
MKDAPIEFSTTRRRCAAAVLAIYVSFVSTMSFAATLAPSDTPETVIRESYRRMQAGDWTAAAETFDPAALKQFREMLAPIMDAVGDGSDGLGLLGMFFGPEATPETLKTMNDQEFFSGIVGNLIRSSGGSLEGQEVVGGVAEGADRMHMVVRSRAAAMGITLTQMEVVTLNKTPDGWRLALSGKMEGMAQALKQLGGASKPPAKDVEN